LPCLARLVWSYGTTSHFWVEPLGFVCLLCLSRSNEVLDQDQGKDQGKGEDKDQGEERPIRRRKVRTRVGQDWDSAGLSFAGQGRAGQCVRARCGGFVRSFLRPPHRNAIAAPFVRRMIAFLTTLSDEREEKRREGRGIGEVRWVKTRGEGEGERVRGSVSKRWANTGARRDEKLVSFALALADDDRDDAYIIDFTSAQIMMTVPPSLGFER
jgi:hypothetical protein